MGGDSDTSSRITPHPTPLPQGERVVLRNSLIRRVRIMISEKYLNHFTSICLILVISFAVYSNSLKNDFVNFDDSWLVLENKKIRTIDFDSIYKMFSEPTASDYLPLKELSYAVDYYFWKFNPFGYHLTNVVLFIINCLLVYLLVFKLFKNKLFALFSCLLFALHPIHAEAVNWISSRKDLLSGAFFFLSLLFYIISTFPKTVVNNVSTFQKTVGNDVTVIPKILSDTEVEHYAAKSLCYFLSMISFIFALFSKPSVIILPLLLPLFEYCFLAEKKPLKAEKIILRIMPFFIIAIVSIAITLSVASEKEVVKTYWGGSPYTTFIAMLGIFFDYIKLLFFPINLNVRYDVPFPASFSDIRVIAGAILFIAFIVISFKSRKHNKLILFCLMWFLITLIPVSNLIPIAILKADRYIYLSSFAFALWLGSVIIAESSSLRGEGRVRGMIFFLIISLCFFVLTINRNTIWKNSLILWEDTVKKSPNDDLVYNSLGTVYMNRLKRDYKKAEFYFKKAIQINPDNFQPHLNLSAVYVDREEYDKALTELETSLALNPNDFRTYVNLGNLCKKKGLADKAIEYYRNAMSIDKKSADPHYNLAMLYNDTNMVDNAIEEYRKAISLDPTMARAYNNIGNIYFRKRLIKEAVEEYRMAIKQDRNFYAANNNLGNALNKAGKYDEAIKYLKIAAGLKKTAIIPHLNLGKIYMDRKMFKNAIEEFERVLDLKPDYYQAHISLGIIFLTLGDKERAIEHFSKSLRLNPKDKTSEGFLKKLNSAN